MGALHDGHASLIREACAISKGMRAGGVSAPVVVSIFVNPTQFNDPSDFTRYPRTMDADAAICRAAGADAIFAPTVEDMYPPGHAIDVPALPAVATQPKLEDAARPGHFAGVCQVVARLFDCVRPRLALFGEKDWQQMQVIRAMTDALESSGRWNGLRIMPARTIREPDGLAMSSRNRFLTPDERTRAVAVSRALREARMCRSPDEAERAMRDILLVAGLIPEYAVIRDAQSLMAPDAGAMRPVRALIAARLGSVRLIDNDAWTPSENLRRGVS
jgi:pantoate--beta-alanine ligase